MELDAVEEQLNATLTEIDASHERLEKYGTGPYLIGSVRNVVFTSQLGKLRDVDDPLIMEVIKLYSDLSSLDKLFGGVNQHRSPMSKLHQMFKSQSFETVLTRHSEFSRSSV